MRPSYLLPVRRMLNRLAENIWETSRPLRVAGVEFGCRMTCVRLSNGSVAVHSPVPSTLELFAAVEALGTVEWLIAPNALHHMFLKAWWERFGSAQVLVTPRLFKRRKDLEHAVGLGEAPEAWGDELEMLPVDGLPLMSEFVFFHRPSATLILTDLAFHFGHDAPFLTRWLFRLTGRLGELAPTALERFLVRDRAACRASIERVLEWPFDRVVVSHGAVLESGGRRALAQGYDWLLTANG